MKAACQFSLLLLAALSCLGCGMMKPGLSANQPGFSATPKVAGPLPSSSTTAQPVQWAPDAQAQMDPEQLRLQHIHARYQRQQQSQFTQATNASC